jgi:hypothetical protein
MARRPCKPPQSHASGEIHDGLGFAIDNENSSSEAEVKPNCSQASGVGTREQKVDANGPSSLQSCVDI